ncbi:MAG TPA: hypothetical protein VLK65_29470 [Vicinamibacteria bacterium]|nr:hypothetical protein [Vicinamibacteria bacterium]
MPYQEPDPSDPNVLIGVSLPGDEETTREMAIAFAEEFAALGFDEGRLMSLFRRPNYAGAHRAYQLLGEEEIRRIVSEALRLWGGFRVVVRDASKSNGEG